MSFETLGKVTCAMALSCWILSFVMAALFASGDPDGNSNWRLPAIGVLVGWMFGTAGGLSVMMIRRDVKEKTDAHASKEG